METQIQEQNSWTRLTGFKTRSSNLIINFILFQMIPFTRKLLIRMTGYRWFRKLALMALYGVPLLIK